MSDAPEHIHLNLTPGAKAAGIAYHDDEFGGILYVRHDLHAVGELVEAAIDLCDVLHDQESEEHFDGHHDDECPLCDGYARVRAAIAKFEGK